MVTALVIGWALAGAFAGFAAHQRQSLLEETDENRDLQQEVLRLTTALTESQCEARAHVTSLEMVLGGDDRADNGSA